MLNNSPLVDLYMNRKLVQLIQQAHSVRVGRISYFATAANIAYVNNLEVGEIICKNYCFNYNKSLVSLATHSQSRLNSFQAVKTLFLHCFACTSELHLNAKKRVFTVWNEFSLD